MSQVEWIGLLLLGNVNERTVSRDASGLTDRAISSTIKARSRFTSLLLAFVIGGDGRESNLTILCYVTTVTMSIIGNRNIVSFKNRTAMWYVIIRVRKHPTDAHFAQCFL